MKTESSLKQFVLLSTKCRRNLSLQCVLLNRSHTWNLSPNIFHGLFTTATGFFHILWNSIFFPHLHYFRLDLCLSLLLVVLFMSNAASFKIDFQCSRRSSNRWENAFQPQFNSFCSTQLNLVDDTNMFLDDFVLFVTYFDDNLPFCRYASSCAVLLASELTW